MKVSFLDIRNKFIYLDKGRFTTIMSQLLQTTPENIKTYKFDSDSYSQFLMILKKTTCKRLDNNLSFKNNVNI